ncbi:MAG TPA: nucleoside deaminase [Terriglobia bacterium]|nr:nucleoside deaminase [Terriglobia bacterium]
MSTQDWMDEKFMRRCLELAQAARVLGEAAVGSVVVDGETIIGEGMESTRTMLDHSAHAEVLAMQAASQTLQSLKLYRTTLYTTVEPCLLCSWVIRKAGIARVVFGTPAGVGGGFTSQYVVLKDAELNEWVSPPEVVSGVLQDECESLLTRNAG